MSALTSPGAQAEEAACWPTSSRLRSAEDARQVALIVLEEPTGLCAGTSTWAPALHPTTARIYEDYWLLTAIRGRRTVSLLCSTT